MTVLAVKSPNPFAKGAAAADDSDGAPVRSLRNAGSGFAALAYRDDRRYQEFDLRTWVRCESAAPFLRRDLRGVAIYVDPARQSFVRLACDYRGEQPVVSLAHVSRGDQQLPQILASWPIPPADGTDDGWRQFSVCSDGARVRVMVDGVFLGKTGLRSREPLSGYLGVTNHPERRGDSEVQFSAFRVGPGCPLMV